jgi:hypothetical protein
VIEKINKNNLATIEMIACRCATVSRIAEKSMKKKLFFYALPSGLITVADKSVCGGHGR